MLRSRTTFPSDNSGCPTTSLLPLPVRSSCGILTGGGGAVPIFKDYDQSQNVFREVHPLQLLEEEHPARVIDRVIELMDLTELYAAYADEGNPAYHPRMMLKVLFYSYYTGLMSCREMWEGLCPCRNGAWGAWARGLSSLISSNAEEAERWRWSRRRARG